MYQKDKAKYTEAAEGLAEIIASEMCIRDSYYIIYEGIICSLPITTTSHQWYQGHYPKANHCFHRSKGLNRRLPRG